MSSESLRVLEAEPIDVNYDSDLDIASPDASTALLQDYPESREEPSPSSSSPPRHRHYVRVIALSLVAAIFIEVGDYMEKAPMMRVIEDILCRKYYESTAPLGTHITLPIPEQECKIPAVQGELAMLKGWDAALACIPGLLLALPYGYIADRYGRKIVLLLSLIGVTLGLAWILLVVLLQAVLDVRWIWAGNAFLCIGGGSSVIKATIYAMFADVTPENKRAAVFFQFIGAVMLSPVIGVPLSWYIMKTSSILAMEVGLASVFCGLLLIFFLPETLDQAKATEAAAHATSGDSLPNGDDMAQPSKMLTIYGVIKGSNFVFAIPVLRTLLITFVIGPVLITSMSYLVQFASDKYHWSIADASFISLFSAIATLIMLVVILPLIYSLLGSRLGVRPAIRDLVVARGSLIFLVLGCLIIGLAPSPGFLIAGTGILSLGAGSVPAIRSLVTSFVHADQVSRLYGVLAVIETIGSLVLNPLFSKSFGWGMSLGGVWSGMVFILAGVITLILSLPVYIVRPPKPEEDIHA